MSWFYPEEKKLIKEDVESYAHACWDILKALGILDGHCKIYDPLTIEEETKTAHSYVFDLQDGGRHHSYESLEQLKEDILPETVNLIEGNISNYDQQKTNTK